MIWSFACFLRFLGFKTGADDAVDMDSVMEDSEVETGAGVGSGGEDGTVNPILASFPSFPGMALRVLIEMGVEEDDGPIVALVADSVSEAAPLVDALVVAIMVDVMVVDVVADGAENAVGLKAMIESIAEDKEGRVDGVELVGVAAAAELSEI